MIYRFEDFELNTERYTLSRAGQTQRLRPKVFQVLRYLMTHSDRVVSKQELAEQVWPDQFIANATLESAVRLLRQALGDTGRTQRIIQTSHGYGYRFAVPVSSPDATPPSDPLSHDETWRCPACQHLNPTGPKAGHRYCVACGAPLTLPCPQCGTDNLPQANFCAACGAGLSGQSAASRQTTDPLHAVPQDQDQQVPPSPMPPERHASRAERRQLTVMVCDLVDAARLPERLDLEDLHELLRAYQKTCADVARRFEGHVARNTSTSMWFYFGYPQAHEDDAHRAVHTGLGIIESLGVLNARLAQEKGIYLQMQLGIHTGPVVIDEQGSEQRADPWPLGPTPNTAAQIQAVAKPDTVVVSVATARLIEGYFTCQELACQPLAGEPEPVRLIQILEATGAVGRLEVAPRGRLTRFVGREAELSLLLERWKQVKEGMGHAVLLSGEPGVGKSRLVQVLQDRIAEDDYLRLACRCSPYYQHSTLQPVVDLLNSVLLEQGDDSHDEKLKSLVTLLTQYELPLHEMVPLLAQLLGLPVSDDRYPSLSLPPQQQRQKTLEAILTLLLAMASRQPVLLVIEDLHWLDPSTLELLTLLMDQMPATSICSLLTYRPTFRVPWTNRSYLTQITLPRLSRQLVEQMITGMTEGRTLPADVLRQVLELTDGIPLFVEELTKTILETIPLREIDDRYELMGPLSALEIPTTLHDSLMARLDRLDTAKGVAQLGATIGRQFTDALLRAVWEQDDAWLQQGLTRLVEAELVYQRGLRPQATYVFKHALIQETAYRSLLKRTRQHYHARIARVLVEQFPETAEQHPELLAHHYTEAGLGDAAIPYWQQAGQRAVERSANHEAIRHFSKALDLLNLLPDTPARIRQELELQLALGSVLRMVRGHTAPDVEYTYTRAYDLSQQIGDSPQRFAALVSLWRFYLNRARPQTARKLAEQCFTFAQDMQDSESLQDAHRMLGATMLFQGEPSPARIHLERGIEMYNAKHGCQQTLSGGMDRGVTCCSYVAWVLWLLGYPEQALTRIHDALTLARKVDHAFSLAFALNWASMLHAFRREVRFVRERAEALIALSNEHGFIHALSVGMIRRGWALTKEGSIDEGLGQLHQGLTAIRDSGTELPLSHHLALLAEAYMEGGQFDAGTQVLTEAQAHLGKRWERGLEAEIYRLKGECLLAQKDTRCREGEAEACFFQAIDIARHQQAKSLELRAAMSLGRLWQQQGRGAEARQILDEAYGWFTEGFETLDLQEAKALLVALQ